MKQVAAYDSKSKDRPPASIDDAIEDIAATTGLYILMQKRGFTRAQLKSCLVDKPSRDKILAMTQEAWEGVKISGTPSFVVDGRLLPGTHDCKGPQPALPEPGKQTRCTETDRKSTRL